MIPIIQLLLAIALPSFLIWKSNKSNPVRHPQYFSAGSFACCAWGIISEFATIKTRLFAGDIGGIEDTMDAVIIISIIMTVITVIANVLALSIAYEKE